MTDDQIYFNISQVAKTIGVVPATIRNWEKEGLITVKRNKNNYRVFDFNDIETLKQIKSYSQGGGMNISAIRDILKKEESKLEITDKKKYYKKIYNTKLKEYRENKNYTLEDVSEAIGISTSYLSRIEQGQGNVSYEILDKLARFYGESAIYFFDVKKGEDTPVVKKYEGKQLMAGISGVTMESLINKSDSVFQSLRFIIEPSCGDFQSHKHNRGFEFIYVLTGKLQVTLNNSDIYLLKEGDSIHFTSTVDHKWHNPGKKDTEILWIHSYL